MLTEHPIERPGCRFRDPRAGRAVRSMNDHDEADVLDLGGGGGALFTEPSLRQMRRCPCRGHRIRPGERAADAAQCGIERPLQPLDPDPSRHPRLRSIVYPGLAPDLLPRPTLRDVADHAVTRIGDPWI